MKISWCVIEWCSSWKWLLLECFILPIEPIDPVSVGNGYNSVELFHSLHRLFNGSKLWDKGSCFQPSWVLENVDIPERIEVWAFTFWFRFIFVIDKVTIQWESYHIFRYQILTWGIGVKSSKHVSIGGFEEYYFFHLNVSDGCSKFLVERQQIFIIVDSWAIDIIDAFTGISSRGLINKIISNNISLGVEEGNNIYPHFNEFIHNAVQIVHKVVVESHYVLSMVVLWKRHLCAWLF